MKFGLRKGMILLILIGFWGVGILLLTGHWGVAIKITNYLFFLLLGGVTYEIIFKKN